MLKSKHTMKQAIILSTLALFAVTALFGLRASMMTNKDGNMPNCPLVNGAASVCRMNVFEHIGAWRSLFAATLPTVILLLVALTLLFLGSSLENFDYEYFLKEQSLSCRRQNFASRLFNHLLLAFRKGVLHSKIFSLAYASR